MCRICPFLFLFLAACSTAGPTHATSEIPDRGKTVVGESTKTNRHGQMYTETYYSDGSMDAISTARDGPGKIYDRGGKWWIENGYRCRIYATWQNGRTICDPDKIQK